MVFLKYNKNFRCNDSVEQLNLKRYKILEIIVSVLLIINLVLIPPNFQQLNKRENTETMNKPIIVQKNEELSRDKDTKKENINHIVRYLLENNISNYSISNTEVEIICDESTINDILKNNIKYKVNVKSFEKYGEDKWNIKLEVK